MNLEGFNLVSDKVLDITKADGMYITNSAFSEFWLYNLIIIGVGIVIATIIIFIKILVAYHMTPTDKKDVGRLKLKITTLIGFVIFYVIVNVLIVSYYTEPDVIHDVEYVKEVKAENITYEAYKSKDNSGSAFEISLKGDMKKNHMNMKVNGIPVHEVIDKTPKTLDKDDKVKVTLKTQYIKAPKSISLKDYSKMVAHNKKTTLDNNVVILEPVK